MASVEPTKYTIDDGGKRRATRDSKWRARWRSPDGKSREKVFARRVEAERHLAGVEHAKLTGGYVDPRAGKVSFRAYAEGWRSRQIHRQGTQVSVEQHLRLHVYPILGERPIAAIKPSEIQGLVRRIEESLAASTVAVVYGRVVAVFRSAMRDRIVAVSPCVCQRRLKTDPLAAGEN
jgi:hypothetical protein